MKILDVVSHTISAKTTFLDMYNYLCYHGVKVQNWVFQQFAALYFPLVIDLPAKSWYLLSMDQTLCPTTQKGSAHAKRKHYKII